MTVLKVTSVATLIKSVRTARDRFGEMPWYRGVEQPDLPLQATVHWRGQMAAERSICGMFMTHAPSRYPNCPAVDDAAGWLCLMRHYGLPTRLLDWSTSSLIAAFFAVGAGDCPDGATIWVLSPSRLNRHFRYHGGIPLLNNPSIRKLLMPAFQSGPKDKRILAVLPPQVDSRMMLQSATFTIHGIETALDHLPGHGRFLMRFDIPAASVASLNEEIRLLGLTRATVFPDLDHLAEEIVDMRRNARGSR